MYIEGKKSAIYGNGKTHKKLSTKKNKKHELIN